MTEKTGPEAQADCEASAWLARLAADDTGRGRAFDACFKDAPEDRLATGGADGDAARKFDAWLQDARDDRLVADGKLADTALAFDAWLAAAPGNRRAFRRALDVWHEVERLRAEILAVLDPPPGSQSS